MTVTETTIPELTVEREDGIATLTIRREAKRNALHWPLWAALRDAAAALTRDPPRAVILTGAGGHFSAGMDLALDNGLFDRVFAAMMARDEDGLRAIIRELKAIVDGIAAIPCPVISAIEGACAGGGLEVALACDFRVAGRGAFFALPETKAGLMCDVGGTVRTVRRLGRNRAAELLLTARRVTAEEALEWGLITRLVEAGGALSAARALAEEIKGCGPVATRETLMVLRQVDGLGDEDAYALETEAGVRTLLGGECVEGSQAFIEKRRPSWKVVG